MSDIEVVLSQWTNTELRISISGADGKYPLIEVSAYAETDSGTSSVDFDSGDLSLESVRAFAQELIDKIDAAESTRRNLADNPGA